MIPSTSIDELRRRLERITLSDPFSDFDLLYNALIFTATHVKGPDEHSKIRLLLSWLDGHELERILALSEVSALIQLKPPLETLISWKRGESSKKEEIKNSLKRLRDRKNETPDRLTAALINVLSTIRNKRYHGFKSPESPRDNEILGNGAVILKKTLELLLMKTQHA